MDSLHLPRRPSVSIGLPVYNGEVFIRDALDSLLAQEYDDFEILISDDASNDKTQEICEDYALRYPRIHYVRQPLNIGAAKNFEYVLKNSRGKYFMWAAHDDMWAPTWLSTLVPMIRDSDFSVRGSIHFIRDGMFIVERTPLNYRKGEHYRFYMQEETTMNARNFYIYGLCHREKLLEVKFDALASVYNPDFIFTSLMLYKGDFRSTGETYQVYRYHENNSGDLLIKKYLTISRLFWRVHPVNYYIDYVSAAPKSARGYLIILTPFKHVYNQAKLWYRGIKKISTGRKNM